MIKSAEFQRPYPLGHGGRLTLFSLDKVAEWPHFGKELLTTLTLGFLCVCLFIIIVIYCFGFEGRF